MVETMKLTPAQKRCLSSVADGTVSRTFDVYGGYIWQEGEKFSTGWRKHEWQSPAPLSRVIECGLAEIRDAERVASGRHISRYVLTDAGRRALSEGGEDGPR